MNIVIVIIVSIFSILILLFFLIKSGLRQKFGKFDMPEESSKKFIASLFPDENIPTYVFPVLIFRLRELGFDNDITIEDVKVQLKQILTDRFS